MCVGAPARPCVRVYVRTHIHVCVYTHGQGQAGGWAGARICGGIFFLYRPDFCTVLSKTPVNTGIYAVQKAVQNCNGLYRYEKHQFRNNRITQ